MTTEHPGFGHFDSDSAFQRGKHKFTPDPTPPAPQKAHRVDVSRARLNGLVGDIEDLIAAEDDERVRGLLSDIHGRLLDISRR